MLAVFKQLNIFSFLYSIFTVYLRDSDICHLLVSAIIGGKNYEIIEIL